MLQQAEDVTGLQEATYLCGGETLRSVPCVCCVCGSNQLLALMNTSRHETQQVYKRCVCEVVRKLLADVLPRVSTQLVYKTRCHAQHLHSNNGFVNLWSLSFTTSFKVAFEVHVLDNVEL